ncbi:MAG TPA: hypothetical protein VK327_07025 [Candidatus Paceibacterota bacterium]|nr:hypothetical protein [Candidatus Paceibacterota bacterium]
MTHLHLILNHVPIFGVLAGAIVLLVARLKRSQESMRVAMGLLAASAGIVIPTFLTGDPAEHSVHGLSGFSEAMLARHEEAAELATIGMVLVGILGIAGLVWFRGIHTIPGWFSGITLASALIVSGLMVRTANFGGQILHSEIRAAEPVVTLDTSDRD